MKLLVCISLKLTLNAYDVVPFDVNPRKIITDTRSSAISINLISENFYNEGTLILERHMMLLLICRVNPSSVLIAYAVRDC
jgi:hypothetical protein